MSYSFNIKASSKTEALTKIGTELVKVTASQPVHETDYNQVYAASREFIALLSEEEAKDIYVAVNGSIWTNAQGVQQVSFNISVSKDVR